MPLFLPHILLICLPLIQKSSYACHGQYGNYQSNHFGGWTCTFLAAHIFLKKKKKQTVAVHAHTLCTSENTRDVTVRHTPRSVLLETRLFHFNQSWPFVLLHNAQITKLSFHVTVISCDSGVACFRVHGL